MKKVISEKERSKGKNMLGNEKLNVGDYIFTAGGSLARIIRVNTKSYTCKEITSIFGNIINVPFNGINGGFYHDEEYFKCDNPTAKALELAYKKWKKAERNQQIYNENKELIGKAKFFLNQIEDIEEEEVEEAEEVEEQSDD